MLARSLTKTRQSLWERIGKLFRREAIDEEFWARLEEELLAADLGIATTLNLVEALRKRATQEGKADPASIRASLKDELYRALLFDGASPVYSGDSLWVILVVGVNGSGKTTSIAKIARYHQKEGRKVIMAAADTFRAAAIDQLQVWGKRLGIEVVAHQPGADPGAVVYDALQAARARGAQVLIADTAGRLHTKYNLMEELKKMQRVISRQVEGAPQEVILVLDATTGQNALVQARYFKEAVEVSGVFLAKLDGTAKGGMAFAVQKELGLPIQYVGTGESVEDMQRFDAQEFVDSLLTEV